MKKILAVLAIITLTMTACADHNHLIEYSELPVQAQAFIQKYFNISDVAVIQVEDFGRSREYDIRLLPFRCSRACVANHGELVYRRREHGGDG